MRISWAFIITIIVFLSNSCEEPAEPEKPLVLYVQGSEIYTIEMDSSNKTRLTNNTEGRVWQPVFTPDGLQIIHDFWDDASNSQIYIMDSDGENSRNLSGYEFSNFKPIVSPDGSKIIFTSDRDGHLNIYSMDIDGGNQLRLTERDEIDSPAQVSPDGSRVLYTSTTADYINGKIQQRIHLMDLDGGNDVMLTDETGFNHTPRISQRGTKIVYCSWDFGQSEIFIMDMDGSNQTRLTYHLTNDEKPRFSPDGSHIIWQTPRENTGWAIYRMDLDGGNKINLSHEGLGLGGIYSPDGKKILFGSARNQTFRLYLMDANGSNQSPLTENQWSEFHHYSWQPIK